MIWDDVIASYLGVVGARSRRPVPPTRDLGRTSRDMRDAIVVVCRAPASTGTRRTAVKIGGFSDFSREISGFMAAYADTATAALPRSRSMRTACSALRAPSPSCLGHAPARPSCR